MGIKMEYTKHYDYDDFVSVYNNQLISSVLSYGKSTTTGKNSSSPKKKEKNFYNQWINYLEQDKDTDFDQITRPSR